MAMGRRSFSEGVKQGPIATGFSCCAKAVKQHLSKQTPRRMGPCFRRDDDDYFRNSKP